MSPTRRVELALAEARHAYDYGTRREYQRAQEAARAAERERLREDAIQDLKVVRVSQERAGRRVSDHEWDQVVRDYTPSVPEKWPSYGPDPERWRRQ